jgi:hypothetical protein
MYDNTKGIWKFANPNQELQIANGSCEKPVFEALGTKSHQA